MIDVSHHKNCWWTSRRKNEIEWNNGTFSSVGVPLKVIFHAFQDRKLVWFSALYGDWEDNVLLLGVPTSLADSFPKKRYRSDTPLEILSALTEKTENIDEFMFLPQMQEIFDINIYTQETNFDYPDGCQIHIHDDCFSMVKPVDKGLLSNLVQSVLFQHSYYLNIEVDWSDVLEILCGELIKANKLELKSKARSNNFMFRRDRRPHLVVKSKGYDKIKIAIEDGKAVIN